MSGAIKSVKKVFKKVVKFIKKALPLILIAVAVYFTAGLALSAFPATASFAASLPGFAGGGFMGLGVGAGATAGTGLFSKAAASFGLGSLGSSGGLVGGALKAGTTIAQLGAAGIKGSALVAGAAKATAAGLFSGAAGLGAPTTIGSIAVGGGMTGPAMNVVGAASKMSIGEKLLLASTGIQALGAFMAPTPAEEKKFVGAFYGTDSKGGGGPIVPTMEVAAPAQAQAPPPARAAVKGERPLVDPSGGIRPAPPQAPRPGGELFAQPQQGQVSGQPLGVPDLFRRMPGVRYVDDERKV